MQKRGYMDKEYEETLLKEIRKRDDKIQMLISVVSGLVCLHVIMLIIIIFFR
jgi:hypothetical protein